MKVDHIKPIVCDWIIAKIVPTMTDVTMRGTVAMAAAYVKASNITIQALAERFMPDLSWFLWGTDGNIDIGALNAGINAYFQQAEVYPVPMGGGKVYNLIKGDLEELIKQFARAEGAEANV